MTPRTPDRYLWGAGAAACAVCCAPPLLALLGIAGVGTAAILATLAFAGLAFGAAFVVAALLGMWARRRVHQAAAASTCDSPDRTPVPMSTGTAPHRTPWTGGRIHRNP